LVDALVGVVTPDGGADSTGEDNPDPCTCVVDAVTLIEEFFVDVVTVDALVLLLVDLDLMNDPKFIAAISNCNCPSGRSSSSSRYSTISSSSLARALVLLLLGVVFCTAGDGDAVVDASFAIARQIKRIHHDNCYLSGSEY
jgi:hypothetical protein